jgi:peptide/nickel transport system substrate-binding protein
MTLLLGLVLSSVVLAACSTSDTGGNGDNGGIVEGDDTDEGEPRNGGTMTYGVEAESAGWQPCRDAVADSGDMVMSAMYDTLMRMADDGRVRPYLAAGLQLGEDQTEWTLTLRPGVRFHDGTPLDAAAVKANFDAAKAPSSLCAGALEPVEAAEVVDPLTVKYVLDSPYGAFPDLLTGAVGSIFSPANAASRGADVSAHPVGAGPFVFESWERDSKLTLTKNPNYWQTGLPHLDSVIIKPIPDEDARLASLTSGELDAMFTLRGQYVRRARELGDSVKRYETIGNNAGGAIFNVTVPPVDDKRIRRALAHAMRQQDLIKILGGEGISGAATQFFSKASPWYSEKVAASYPAFDLAKGKALVDAYVNDPARSDHKSVGSAVQVTFNCPPDPTLVAVAQGYQQMAAGVGIEMELRQVEQATHIANAVGKPPFTSADYMINCWRLGSDADPDTTLFNSYGPSEGQAANFTNFTNAELQAQLKIGRESAEFERRYAAYEKVGLIFDDEVPHVFTGAVVGSTVTKPTVRGVARYPFPDGKTEGRLEGAATSVAHLWIAD